MGYERRRAPRVAYVAVVMLFYGNRRHYGLTETLSRYGAFINTSFFVPGGTSIPLKIDLDDGDEPLSLWGHVIRDATSPPQGVAIEFHEFEDANANRIARATGG